jgi:hypothetical protein
MVDEFDGLNEDLVEAHWGMEGKEIRRRVREVGRAQGVDVVRVEDGEMCVVDKRELREDEEEDDEWLHSEASARAHGFMAMLQGVVGRVRGFYFYFISLLILICAAPGHGFWRQRKGQGARRRCVGGTAFQQQCR